MNKTKNGNNRKESFKENFLSFVHVTSQLELFGLKKLSKVH